MATTALALGPGTEEKIQKAIQALFESAGPAGKAVKNFLNGTWLGEPLHVVLTDVPIGAWTVALIFDGIDWVSNRRQFSQAADTSVIIGLLGAGAAAVTGATDWQDIDPPSRETGLTHAFLNMGATALFSASLIFRRKKARALGQISALIGYGVVALSAHLGGKLVYQQRVGVDRTAGETFPDRFKSVLPEAELEQDRDMRVEHEGAPILLIRRGSKIFALAETCSHFGGPLSQGDIEGDSVVCPWHGSRFALEDGRVLDGPAVHPQPCLQVRVRTGQIQVCKPKTKP